MSEPFLGELRLMAFNFAPRGWAPCNGQLLPINQNQALFSLLGTMYGGNGQTNFALPDLRGRTPIHVGAGLTQGQRGGEESHTLTVSEMPTHPHIVQANTDPPDNAGGNTPATTKVLSSTSTGQLFAPFGNAQQMSAQMIGNTGGSQPHTNLMPYTVIGICIALIGIFPSRD
jgi:microcystin-dependent protein